MLSGFLVGRYPGSFLSKGSGLFKFPTPTPPLPDPPKFSKLFFSKIQIQILGKVGGAVVAENFLQACGMH